MGCKTLSIVCIRAGQRLREQVNTLQTSPMRHFAKIVSSINIKLLTILAKRSILDACLVLVGASAGGCNTVIKIQTEISLTASTVGIILNN